MTIPAAPVVGDPAPDQADPASAALPVLAAEAVSTLATRLSFVVLPWLLLAGDAGWRTTGLVAAAQVLAYALASPLGIALADRLRPVRVGVAADLLGALALAAAGFVALPDAALVADRGLLGTAALGGAAALVGALRAVADRAKNAARRDADPEPAGAPRSGLAQGLQAAVLLIGGAAAGVLAVRLGPAGVLWLNAVLCALAAAMLVQAVTVRPRPAAAGGSEVLSGEVLPAGQSAPADRSASGDPAAEASREPGRSDGSGDAAHRDGSGDAARAGGSGTAETRAEGGAGAEGAGSVNGVAPRATIPAQGGSANGVAVHAVVPAQHGGPSVNGSHPQGAAGPRPEAAPPIARTQARDLRRSAMAELRADGLVRRLAVVLFLTNLLVQGGAVLLVAAWTAHVLDSPDLLGLVGGAFLLGAVTGGVVLTGLSGVPSRWLLAAVAFLVGGGTAAVLGGLPPVLLVVAVAAFVCGATMSSVTPALGLLLSQRVPAPVRSRVAGFASVAAYLGIPLGTAAAAWALPVLELRWALAAAAGAYLLALLVPVFAYRTWRQLSAGAPAVLTGAAKLPARLSVTLAYANGQWLVEVRKGRALLGTRHLVKSAEALNMLSLLDVPGVRRSVEEALTVDQTEAARQAERMRSELAELEAKLAGLTEMAELSEVRLPAQPAPQSTQTAQEKVAGHG